MSQRVTGKVKWFKDDKGFGFITRDDGQPDVFVHWTGISGPRGGARKSLEIGQRVEFDIVQSEKGPKAANVAAI